MNTGGIYKLVSKRSGKMYIGQTKNFVTRKSTHFRHLKKNKHDNPMLQNYYNKYTSEYGTVFVFEIIEKCDDSLLDEREIHFIALLNTQDRSIGFNRTSGGKGARKSKDIQALIIPKNKKKIGQYDLEGNLIKIHDSIMECCAELNINRQNLKKGMRRYGNVKGFLFSFSLDIKINPYKQLVGQHQKLKCYVFNISGDLLSEHESIHTTSKEYNIFHGIISYYYDTNKFYQNKYCFSSTPIFKPIYKVDEKIYVFNIKGIIVSIHDNIIEASKYHGLIPTSVNKQFSKKRLIKNKFYLTTECFFDYNPPKKQYKKIHVYDINKKYIQTFEYINSLLNVHKINRRNVLVHLKQKKFCETLQLYFLYQGDTF